MLVHNSTNIGTYNLTATQFLEFTLNTFEVTTCILKDIGHMLYWSRHTKGAMFGDRGQFCGLWKI